MYGLRHVSEIWRGTELGFDDTGIYKKLQGQTIDRITYYLNDGTARYISTNIPVHYSSRGASVSVADAGNTALETTVTTADLPDGFVPSYAVTKGDEDLSAFNFMVADGKLTWEGTPAFGVYTLTVSDGGGKYAPVSTTFELKTSDVYAKYDAERKVLVKASDEITDEQFTAYLNAISVVSVDGTDYAASGKNAVKIIQDNGAVDMTVAPFNKGAGATYSIVVKATGYQDLTFSIITPRKSSSSSSSSTTTTNTVSASTASNGKVTLDKSTAKKGDTVTITVTPDAGYELGKLTVTDAKGNTIAVSKKFDNQYTFTMPDGKVTVVPTFTKVADEKPSTNGYVDVSSYAWYNDAVQYVADKGLMNGTGDNKFSPNASTTRGMLMTVLARYAGEDTTGGATWYEKGMNWAKAKGVSDGTNPNADITREQLVTMLYRYAGSPAANGSLDSFSDAASVSSYAVNAMQWAVANGIVNGSNGKLDPQNNATRAQVAAILMRFCEMSK